MELLSAIKSIQYTVKNYSPDTEIRIFTDSQYLARLKERKDKLKSSGFVTKKGTDIGNRDLVSILIDYIEKLNIRFIKVEAHSNIDKKNNLNRTADMLARKIVRAAVKSLVEEKKNNGR